MSSSVKLYGRWIISRVFNILDILAADDYEVSAVSHSCGLFQKICVSSHCGRGGKCYMFFTRYTFGLFWAKYFAFYSFKYGPYFIQPSDQ